VRLTYDDPNDAAPVDVPVVLVGCAGGTTSFASSRPTKMAAHASKPTAPALRPASRWRSRRAAHCRSIDLDAGHPRRAHRRRRDPVVRKRSWTAAAIDEPASTQTGRVEKQMPRPRRALITPMAARHGLSRSSMQPQPAVGRAQPPRANSTHRTSGRRAVQRKLMLR
jgi:hypothetical protein